MIKNYLRAASEFIEKNPFSGVVISSATFLFVALLSLTTVYQIFELKLYDFRFQIKPQIDEWDRLVFLDMDDNSIISIGNFPWPRRVYAKALDSMKLAGVSQVTLDIIFPDKSPRQINEQMFGDGAGHRGNGTGRTDLKDLIIDNDKLLSEGIARMGKVITPYNFFRQKLTRDLLELYSTDRFKRARERFLGKASIAVPKNEWGKYSGIEDKGITTISFPIPEIMETAKSFGFVDRDSDPDGTLRSIRLVRFWDGRLFFNLSIAMLMDICRVTKDAIVVEPGTSITLKNAFNPITHEIKDFVIPIDDKGMMLINWAGPGPRLESFRNLPFYALIDYYDFVKDDDSVYNLFDELGEDGANVEIAMANGEIEKFTDEYKAAASPHEKKIKWDALMERKGKILKLKEGLLSILDKEIASVEKNLKKSKDSGLRRYLESLKTSRNACEVVVKVESLQDSYIVAGLTGTSSHDLTTIPTATDYARVGTYFNTINTILQNDYIRKAGRLMNLFLMLAISLVIGIILQRFRARTSLFVIALSFFGLTIAIMLLFSITNIWVDQLGITLSLLLPSVIIGSIKFLSEERQKRFIKSAFSYYLAPGVIDEIIQNPESLVLGGESREITIFFSDVASFSSISEKLSPPQLVSLLNEYLSEMTDIILSYNGTVDKYQGDAIMAFFGAPKHYEDHALKTCLASIDMKRRLRELQEHWRSIGRDALSARIGINTGIAVVGNMGSKTRMDYTVMGDSVNLASRLEGANKYYKTSAMISGSTYEKVKDQVEARKLDVIRVVGKQESVTIYELLGRKGSLPDRMYEMMENYYLGMEHFNLRDWKKSRQLFKQGLQIIPDDGPSLTYVERCTQFIKKSPPKNWDGVYTLKSK